MIKYIFLLFLLVYSPNIQTELTPKHNFIIKIEDVPEVVNKSEVSCLAKVIFHEAGNQPGAGKAAIASTVFNRMKKNNKGICDTIYQSHQFTFTRKPNKPIKIDTWISYYHLAHSIILDYKKGSWQDNIHGATFFHGINEHPYWRYSKKLVKVAKIGDHIFYKEKDV